MLGCSLVLAQALAAQMLESPDTLVPEASPLARVETPSVLPHECLAPVEISRIDGVERGVPARGFPIEPGVHSFNGRAVLDTTRCRPLADVLVLPRADDLVLEIEAGKAYFIAYDRSHPEAQNWRLVVWNIEDIQAEQTEESDPDEAVESETASVQ